jgi:hypothetical protein
MHPWTELYSACFKWKRSDAKNSGGNQNLLLATSFLLSLSKAKLLIFDCELKA